MRGEAARPCCAWTARISPICWRRRQLALNQVDRGEHTLTLQVTNDRGSVTLPGHCGALSIRQRQLRRASRPTVTVTCTRRSVARPGSSAGRTNDGSRALRARCAVAAEHALPSALSHFDSADLLDALSTGIIMLDAQLCPMYANVAAQDLLAFSLNQSARPPLRRSPAAMRNGLMPILRRSLETGESLRRPRTGRCDRQARRASRASLDVTITPLEGEITGTHLLLELADTTQRQRISRENDMLARLDGSRLMLRQLAHEIKNPLGGLRGAAQLLERELPTAELKEYTQRHHRRGRPPDARWSTRWQARPAAAEDLSSTSTSSASTCSTCCAARRPAGVAIERDYDPSLPNASFDRNQMIQALLNVARNALQAQSATTGASCCAPAPAPTSASARRRHRLVASVQVEDNGPGVPATCAPASSIRWSPARPTAPAWDLRWRRIWSPAMAASSNLKVNRDAPCSRCCCLCERNRMSTLTLRVWLVDDDASIRWVLERALRNGGMAAAGPSMRRSRRSMALRRDAPDVLITDIRMPGSSGLELLQADPRDAPDAAGHRHDGVLGSGQRRVGLRGRRVRVSAQALRHRPGGGAGAARARSGALPGERGCRQAAAASRSCWAARRRCSRCSAPSAACRAPASRC